MLTVQVRHTDLALSNLIAVRPVRYGTVCMPELSVLQIVLNIGMITGQMVGNNVNDYFDTIFIGFLTKRTKIVFCSQIICSYIKSKRLIEPIPNT